MTNVARFSFCGTKCVQKFIFLNKILIGFSFCTCILPFCRYLQQVTCSSFLFFRFSPHGVRVKTSQQIDIVSHSFPFLSNNATLIIVECTCKCAQKATRGLPPEVQLGCRCKCGNINSLICRQKQLFSLN